MRNQEEAKAKDRGPRVVIDGVVVKNGGEKDKPNAKREPRGAFVLFFFALIFVGILILASGFFASCASTAAIKADGALRLDIKAEIPSTLAAKLRSLSGKDPGVRLFDEASLRRSIEARSDFKILALAAPDCSSSRLPRPAPPRRPSLFGH